MLLSFILTGVLYLQIFPVDIAVQKKKAVTFMTLSLFGNPLMQLYGGVNGFHRLYKNTLNGMTTLRNIAFHFIIIATG